MYTEEAVVVAVCMYYPVDTGKMYAREKERDEKKKKKRTSGEKMNLVPKRASTQLIHSSFNSDSLGCDVAECAHQFDS